MEDKNNVKFTIVIDSREQTPLIFTRPTVTAGLYAGDYSVVGLENIFCVERKSLDDLAGCCGKDRDRFEHELRRVAGCYYRRLLIIGTRKAVEDHCYKSKINPASMLATVDCYEARFCLPVVWCKTPESAASFIERLSFWIVREQIKIFNGVQEH